MDFTNVTAGFLLATYEGDTQTAGTTASYLTAAYDEVIRTAQSTAVFLKVLHDLEPPPSIWHSQWRFIETRET